MEDKKILIISYYFPPLGGDGIQRTLNFVKYLPEYGWQPVVLTTKGVFWMLRDEELLKSIPQSVNVYRTKSFGLQYHKYCNPHLLGSKTLFKNLRRVFIRMLFFPLIDPEIGWVLSALILAKKIIKQENIDIIYTTSPPHSVNYVGYFLKRLTGVRWVADFRDSWASTPNLDDGLYAHRMRRRVMNFYENRVISDADFIITVTQETKEDFVRRHRDMLPDRLRVITHGFNEDNFENISIEKKDSSRFVLTYTGTFPHRQTPRQFLEALKSIAIEMPEIAKDIEVYFIGTFRDEELRLFNDPVIQKMITIKSYVSHRESILYQLKSDALLLIVSMREKEGGGQVLPGKIGDYIRAKKSIFAIVPQGAARIMIEKYNLGICANPENVKEIKDAFLELYRRYKSKSLSIPENPELLRRLNRQNLTKELAKILNML